MITTTAPITSLGYELDQSDGAFGWMTDSRDLLDDLPALRQRLDRDGYLYLPGWLDVDQVDASRERLLEQVGELGMLREGAPYSEGLQARPWVKRPCHDLIHANAPLQKLLFSGRMIEIFERLLENPVRHFDFTWIRVMGAGKGTAPHADSVYMNRGTKRLYTSWVPLIDVPLEVGGLTVMPGTHRHERLVENYAARDVDSFCENKPQRAPKDTHGWTGPAGDGKLSDNPVRLQKGLKAPWLTAEHYRPGDLVIFSIYTVHGSLDNHTDKVRLSTDTRYQRADEPADERWVGASPMGHGKSARRGMIC